VQFDEVDLPRLAQHNWVLFDGHAVAYIDRKRNVKMSRYLVQPPANIRIWHINGNTRDNRRSNYRFQTLNPTVNY
jgi:hypothetical protein